MPNKGYKQTEEHKTQCKMLGNKNPNWKGVFHGNGNLYKRNKISIEQKKRNQKNLDLKKKYKITLDDYEKLYEIQGGLCDICGKQESERLLSIDHDHKTGKVRGLLCSNCNLGLEMFKDNTSILLKAIIYLNKIE